MENTTKPVEMTNTLTIQGAVARAKSEGIPISEYSLRKLVKAGVIPARMIGEKARKALIFWPNLRDFLTCADGIGDVKPDDENSGFGMIHRKN